MTYADLIETIQMARIYAEDGAYHTAAERLQRAADGAAFLATRKDAMLIEPQTAK